MQAIQYQSVDTYELPYIGKKLTFDVLSLIKAKVAQQRQNNCLTPEDLICKWKTTKDMGISYYIAVLGYRVSRYELLTVKVIQTHLKVTRKQKFFTHSSKPRINLGKDDFLFIMNHGAVCLCVYVCVSVSVYNVQVSLKWG